MRTLVVLGILLMAGCGAREEIVVSQLSLSHQGWDTLQVSVGFARKTVLGGIQPTEVSYKHIVAFNASYDTLYAGTDSVFAIPDMDLGNEEPILVEVCGNVKALKVCEQGSIYASPKRITLTPDIKYPLRKKVFEGEYKLPFVVERLDAEVWKEIKPSSTLQGYLKAFVQGREDESILLPFTQANGGFNLAYKSNYKDFKFYLDSALLDNKEASVIFDVYVDLEGFAGAVGRAVKEIQMKSEEEHKQDVALFAEQYADRIVNHLSPFLRKKKNTVFIDKWTYNTFRKMYAVEMEIEWDGTLFNRSKYRMAGLLEVYEDGDRTSFKYLEGNRRARQRWESRVNGEILNLSGATEVLASNDGERDQTRQQSQFREQGGNLVIEAEDFETSRAYNKQSWSVKREPSGFKGNGVVVVAPDKGVRIRSRYNKRSPELTYPVHFSETGDYYIWLRVWAEDDNSNSVHLGINGAANRSSSYIGTEIYKRWIWTRKQLDNNEYARVQITSAGDKKLNLWMREDGFYVDRIILTKDRYFAPVD